MKFKALLAMLLIAVVVTACSQAESLQVQEAWARPAPAGSNGGVFFVVKNPTGQPDRLLLASAPVAETTELHLSMMHHDGTMSMQPQEAIDVPARSTVKFEPGGFHVMLIGLKQELKPGDKFLLTLSFERAGEIQVEVTVKQP